MDSKWVSVKDELPKEEGFYITYDPTDDTPVFSSAWKDNHFEVWVDVPQPNVTHWQPLPLPPTEEPNSISNEPELSIDEIENVVSKGLDENYYPNLPKRKYEMVGEDELVGVFAEVFGKHDRQITYNPQPLIALRNAKECAKIALQYHQSKIEELEKRIDEQIDYWGDVTKDEIIEKIKSL